MKALLYADGSPRSRSAAAWVALMMKTDPSMRLTVISFVTYVPGYGMQWDDGTAIEYAVADVEERVMASTRKVFEEHRVAVETVVGFSFGTAGIAASIVDYARRGGFHVIVLGARQKALPDAVVENVLRLSTVPVLLVKKLPAAMLAALTEDK